MGLHPTQLRLTRDGKRLFVACANSDTAEIIDTAAGKVDIYLDCVKKLTIDQSAPDSTDGWYNKYGVYNLGGATAQSEWRNVRFYRK